MSQKINEYSLDNLLFARKLPKQQFFDVLEVEERKSGLIFQAKVVKRQDVKDAGLTEFMENERLMGSKVRHPFIQQSVKIFKDRTRLFNLQEYVQGVDLYAQICDLGSFNKQESQFYIGSILLSVNYLH